MDVRADQVLLSVRSLAQGWVTPHDVELARRISAMVGEELRLATDSEPARTRAVQVLEIGIDALDIPRIRPFWKAILAYADEPGAGNSLTDPLGQGPPVWFQQMDAPRPAQPDARRRLGAARPGARADRGHRGGRGHGYLDAEAPAFWVLADPEGDEAWTTTWRGRDK